MELVSDLLQEGGDAGPEVIIGLLVKGELPAGGVVDVTHDLDGVVTIPELHLGHLLPTVLQHDPLIGEHLLDESGQTEPEGVRLTDGEVTISTTGIDNDTLVLLPEVGIKSLLEINGVGTGETVKHNSIFSVSHILYPFVTTKITLFFELSKFF